MLDVLYLAQTDLFMRIISLMADSFCAISFNAIYRFSAGVLEK